MSDNGLSKNDNTQGATTHVLQEQVPVTDDRRQAKMPWVAERDVVYEQSLQSFPASDPPSWTGVTMSPTLISSRSAPLR